MLLQMIPSDTEAKEQKARRVAEEECDTTFHEELSNPNSSI